MKDRNNGESVRQARILAKKTARAGAMSHQQALDQVAREKGHANWSAFLRSERPDDSGRSVGDPPKPKGATIMQVVETGILERAASDAKVFPRWSIRLIPAIAAVIYATLGTVLADWGDRSVVIGIVAGLIVLVLGLLADGGGRSIAIRTHLHRTGVFVGMPAMIIGAAILVVMTSRHGFGILLPENRDAMTEAGGAVLGIGSVIRAVGMYGHRAMVLAAPETVRPASEGPTYFDATPARASRRAAKASMIAVATFFAIMLVAVGFMMRELYDLTVTGAMDPDRMSTAITVATAAGFLALLVSPILDLARARPAMIVQDAHTRAARARRFLGIGQRGTRS